MTGQVERRSASSSVHPIVKILLIQLGLGMVVAMLFWGMNGPVSGYSAVLGSLICVVPNAFLALRLTVRRLAERDVPRAAQLTRKTNQYNLTTIRRTDAQIEELRQNYSVVIVTHSMQQAARVSQKTAFFHLGILVEYGETGKIFTNPEDKRTEDYITGRIG